MKFTAKLNFELFEEEHSKFLLQYAVVPSTQNYWPKDGASLTVSTSASGVCVEDKSMRGRERSLSAVFI